MNNNTALVLIDLQVLLFSYPLYKGEELLENIAVLTDKARRASVPIIYIQHTQGADDPMGKEKDGWKIHPQIAIFEEDIIVLKSTPDSFYGTDLQEELNSRNITNLVIAGLQTEYCVDTTCRRAFSLGYKTTLVKDGHSTYPTKDLSAAQIIDHHNQILGGWFAELKSVDEVCF